MRLVQFETPTARVTDAVVALRGLKQGTLD